MNLSFHEKSIWISLVATLAVFGYYQYQVAVAFFSPNSEINLNLLFFGAIILTVIIQVVTQSILAIMNKKDSERGLDERDRIIQLKSLQISHYILVFGIWVAGLCLFLEFTAPMIAHAALFFFILSEITGFTVQLIQYRRGS